MNKKLLLMIFYTKFQKTLQNHFIYFLTSGVGTRKTFTLMCIIQNMLRYYIKQITNVDPLKPKIMKLAYTRKTKFNINDTIIHSTLTIPLN